VINIDEEETRKMIDSAIDSAMDDALVVMEQQSRHILNETIREIQETIAKMKSVAPMKAFHYYPPGV
jgi:hypothetical protein